MILALSGYSKVGKDTLCERLENFHRLAFADVLKQQVTSMLKTIGIEADLCGADKEEWRDMLWSTGAGRCGSEIGIIGLSSSTYDTPLPCSKIGCA